MNTHYKVPLYANTPDNIHCVQASMKMVCEYFLPEKKLSFEEWDRITAHKPGLWTWGMAGLIWFQDNGFEVINAELMDYQAFSQRGGDYLIDFFGEEVGKVQIKYSDIEQEKGIAKDFIKKVKLEVRVPTLGEMKRLLADGYLILCNINACALDRLPGYSGHCIVIVGCTDSTLILHDPGLPVRGDFEVADALFQKAWAYPDEKAPNFSALRLKR